MSKPPSASGLIVGSKTIHQKEQSLWILSSFRKQKLVTSRAAFNYFTSAGFLPPRKTQWLSQHLKSLNGLVKIHLVWYRWVGSVFLNSCQVEGSFPVVLVHSRSSNMVTKLGVVACTYNVSHSGG
jgi:hypothetical protein